MLHFYSFEIFFDNLVIFLNFITIIKKSENSFQFPHNFVVFIKYTYKKSSFYNFCTEKTEIFSLFIIKLSKSPLELSKKMLYNNLSKNEKAWLKVFRF